MRVGQSQPHLTARWLWADSTDEPIKPRCVQPTPVFELTEQMLAVRAKLTRIVWSITAADSAKRPCGLDAATTRPAKASLSPRARR